jgi:hypothetical protein
MQTTALRRTRDYEDVLSLNPFVSYYMRVILSSFSIHCIL